MNRFVPLIFAGVVVLCGVAYLWSPMTTVRTGVSDVTPLDLTNIGAVLGGLSGRTSSDSLAIPISSRLSVTPGVERWYTNDARSFSFRLPDGFSAPDIYTDEPNVSGVAVRADEKDQLVVLVYQVPLLQTLSEEGIEEIVGVTLTDTREVLVSTVVRALQFRTDDGYEVWTIHNGRLYRILTSAENKDLLDFILASWYFAPPVPSVRK